MTNAKPLKLHHATGKIFAEVSLPSSKSESNRALIINALTQNKCVLHNLSDAHDTQLLQKLLNSGEKEWNAEDAGTAMRFLTAFAAVTNQSKILTGTPRMQQRPIGLLVDALRELGADIEYLKTEGYPPLQINGIDLSWPAQEITVPGHVSSQFISALLLVAPVLPLGLTVNISPPVSSLPYIDMTLEIMRHFQARCYRLQNTVIVEPHPYQPNSYTVPADWSSAAYWYSICALATDANILLTGLKKDLQQADSVVIDLLTHWGVETTFTPKGAHLTKLPKKLPQLLELNFTPCPDLAPTIIVLAAATGVALRISGLESLKIKETDRVAALRTELAKFGARLEENSGNWQLMSVTERSNSAVFLNTYSDHRMAMSFAPLALQRQIIIEQPETVKKSYPKFWPELEKAGFEIKQ